MRLKCDHKGSAKMENSDNQPYQSGKMREIKFCSNHLAYFEVILIHPFFLCTHQICMCVTFFFLYLYGGWWHFTVDDDVYFARVYISLMFKIIIFSGFFFIFQHWACLQQLGCEGKMYAYKIQQDFSRNCRQRDTETLFNDESLFIFHTDFHMQCMCLPAYLWLIE